MLAITKHKFPLNVQKSLTEKKISVCIYSFLWSWSVLSRLQYDRFHFNNVPYVNRSHPKQIRSFFCYSTTSNGTFLSNYKLNYRKERPKWKISSVEPHKSVEYKMLDDIANVRLSTILYLSFAAIYHDSASIQITISINSDISNLYWWTLWSENWYWSHCSTKNCRCFIRKWIFTVRRHDKRYRSGTRTQ